MSEELKEAFKVFDRDQDGFICANEVNMFLNPRLIKFYVCMYFFIFSFFTFRPWFFFKFLTNYCGIISAVKERNDKSGGEINR